MQTPPDHPSSTDRRGFIRTAGVVLGTQLLPGCATLGGGRPGYIDAHVHVWTPDTKTYPLAAGFSVKKDMRPASFTPEQLFALCKPEGVTRVVLIQMSFYKCDNRYMLDMMAQHRGVFSGVATVDENSRAKEHSNPVAHQMRQLAGRGVRGFRIYTSKAQAEAWSQSADMGKMWTCAADHGLAMCLLADPDALPIVQKMCARFPKTRVVIDHFARIGMKGPVRQSDLDNLRRLADFPHTCVKTSAFYALGKKKAPYTDLAPMIRALRDAFGAQRLMWASDAPFQVEGGHTYANSIALIRDRLDFLTAEDKEWMLRKTAEKVFFN
jgi:predicted TIM-barrel fold metal-dependent hydrolase